MRRKSIKIFVTSAAMLLLGSGFAGAIQTPLDPTLIPQFVEPLPLLEFEFVNATNQNFTGVGIFDLLNGGTGLGVGLNGTTFNVDAEEFRSQILPTPGHWTPPATCGADTASSTYGYRTGTSTGIDPVTNIHTTYLGPVVIAETGVASNPTYGNNIPDPTTGPMGVVQFNMPIDRTLDWAMSTYDGTGPVGCGTDGVSNYTNLACGDQYPFYSGPMPIATHLHGGEVPPAFDGGPDAWFTPGAAHIGPGYPGATYNYPNNQQESLIWFHDHALGITRLNVFAGLAGIQPIIDPANPPLTALPQLADGYHVPLIIQDRSFDDNCEIYYNLASNPQPNPLVHPFWIPEFIGDTITVNGKTWPYFDVEPRQYRFSFVNGSNARFYELTFTEPIKAQVLKQFVIATDDGYLEKVANSPLLVIGPGERYEVIVDFSKYNGKEIILMNSAPTPYPGGGPVVAGLTDTVMKFRVNQPLSAVPDTDVKAGSKIRSTPLHKIVQAHNPAMGSITRQLTLNESASALGPLELVVNNSKFNLSQPTPGCNTAACRETEIPAVGDTEIWEIINISADAHPMHTHLTSFQLLDRTPFNAAAYMTVYDTAMAASGHGDGEGPPYTYNNTNADGAIGGNPAIGPYLDPLLTRPPANYEKGWKDTVIAYPGEVTRIAVRWAPTDLPAKGAGAPVVGVNSYVGFNPTILEGTNVGYVWHCHIVDHEDNEMMRNYTVGTVRQPVVLNGAF